MSKSVFEMMMDVMNSCGWETLAKSIIGTAIIILVAYGIPIGIEEAIKKGKEKNERKRSKKIRTDARIYKNKN